MKLFVIRMIRCCRFHTFRLFLMSVSLALSGCGGGGSSGPAVRTYVAGTNCFGNAIDSAGNVWVANGGNGIPGTAAGNSNITKLSPSGAVIGTYVAGTFPIGIAIDKSGNVWVENYGTGTAGTSPGMSNVTELSPTGAVIGT